MTYQEGIYATDNPNVRVVVEQDNDFFDPGHDSEVREELIKAHEAGDVYGVILEHKVRRVVERENLVTGEKSAPATSEVWEIVDSLWSCAGYEKVAEEVARDHFGVKVLGKVGG